MEFSLRWTAADMWDAHWLILKKRQYALFILPAILVVGGAMIALSILLIVRDEKGIGFFFLIASLFLVVGSIFYKAWRLRQYAKISESELCVDISFLDEGIRAKRNEAEAFIKWEAFSDWWDDERVLVLIRKDKSLSFMFPTRHFSQDQLKHLKELFAAKIPVRRSRPL